MHKRTSILILFISLIFFTTASYAEDNSIKVLIAQVSAAHNQIKDLQKENGILKKKLASRENEIAGYRLRLELIEAEIAALSM